MIQYYLLVLQLLLYVIFLDDTAVIILISIHLDVTISSTLASTARDTISREY